MIIIDYNKKQHKLLIKACVSALKKGKVIAYPTDTSYGLAVDASDIKAVRGLYKIKGRKFNKPVHVVVPSVNFAKEIVQWDKNANKLCKKFWPGALTLVLSIKYKEVRSRNWKILSSNSGFLGVRMPKNNIAADLAKYLKKPITATSANVSGQPDCYSAQEILEQFKKQKYNPDIIINAGKLPKRKPSTVVKSYNGRLEILREGPISGKQIYSVINR